MEPLISVIIPVYNVQDYLEKCLLSVVSQSYENIEIILVNDGSLDNSGNICDEFAKIDSRVRVFHIQNSGVSFARNYGIDNSSGDFICFIDSDDYVNNRYISNMVNKIISTKAEIVICGIKKVKLINSEEIDLGRIFLNYEGFVKKSRLKWIMGDLIDSSYINYCYSKLFNMNVIKKYNIRFKNDISLGEDTIFNIEYIRNCDDIYISSSTYYSYVIHSDNSLTYKYRPDKFEILNDLSIKICKFCIEENLYTEKVKEKLDERYFEMVMFCLNENFKSIEELTMSERINNINRILNNNDVISFITKNKSSLNKYNKLIIASIGSRNALYYCTTYLLSIVINKIRRSYKF